MSRLRELATAALVAGGGAIVLGQLGRFWAPADWLNHFFPLWILVTLAGCAGLLVDRAKRWRRAGLILAAVLLMPAGIAYLAEAAPHRDAKDAPAALRVVQFNVFKGNSMPEAAARWILDQKADVVVLEEAADGGGAVRDLLAAAYPHAVDCVGQQTRCSTVILTTEAPAERGGLARGDPENQNGLSVAWARLAAPARRATIVGVHLGRPWPFGDQAWQIDELAQFLKGADRDHAIVAGDFNQSPWTYAMRRQDRAIGLRRITGDRASWPLRDIAAPLGDFRTLPILPIDHVYVGRCWVRSSIRSGPWLGSDHTPLVIDLADRCPPDRPKPVKANVQIPRPTKLTANYPALLSMPQSPRGHDCGLPLGTAMKLGVATHFEQGWGTEWLAKAKSVGADLIRDEQSWGKNELSPGNYNFPASQSAYLQMAAGENIPALLVFTSGNALYDSGYTPYTAAGRQAYANYIVAVLKKYGPEVKEIEVWNEFNGNYSGPGADDRSQSYTLLLKTVWDTVKPLFPDVQILGGSTNVIGTGALESIFKLGALNYMDGVVVHPYRSNPEHVDDELTHLQNVMAGYGAVKPIYATEMSNNFANAADAPGWMVKMVTLLSSVHVAQADWYSLVDEPWFQNMGLFAQNGDAKPAASAFSFLQTLLDKGDAVRVNPDDDLTPVYRYGSDTYVMWSAGQNVSFAAGSHVYNAMGQEISAPATLGATPIVVKGGYTLGSTNVVADSLMQFNEGDWQYFAKNSAGALTPLANMDWTWTSFLGTKWTNPLRVNADAVTPFGDASNPIQVVERFVSDRAQTIKINGNWKTGAGDGVDLHILVNNVEVLTKVFQGAFSLDGYTVNLKAGDTLDFALGPNQTFGGDDTGRRITLYRVDGAANAIGGTISGTANTVNGELVQGTDGDDTIQGLGGPNDTLMGGAGNDVIFAHVMKTPATDAITDSVQIAQRAQGDSSLIRGEDGNDVIYGGAGFDDINGNKGDDTIHGGLGNDWVVGGQGADVLFGDKGDDIVYGNLGDDTLWGGEGNDIIRGGQGDDVIDGGAGDDTLWGDRGNDIITGGAGADQFRFLAGSGADRVTDFSLAQGDKVVVEGSARWTTKQVGADTVITLDDGETLTLTGVPLSSLMGHDWIVGVP